MDQQPTTDLEALRQIGALLDGGYSVSDKRVIVTQAAAEIERLREVLQLATNALSDGLWDYGPGQDEHDKCDEVIEICRAALAQEQGESDDIR